MSQKASEDFEIISEMNNYIVENLENSYYLFRNL